MAPGSTDPVLMNRFDLCKRIVSLADDDTILVAGIGNAGFDLFNAEHRELNFYMLGSMGLAIPIGLGLAIAQPNRTVVVMEGEGSILMNLGALSTVGREAPENLTIVIWDNGQWQITGGQAVATSETTDLAAVASACGIKSASMPLDAADFERTFRFAIDAPGPHAIVAKIDDSPALAPHHDDPIRIKHQFMQGLGVSLD